MAHFSADSAKQAAACFAVDFVRPGMRLGLGTGSTIRFFVDALAEKVAAGMKVRCVSSSSNTQAQALKLNIPLTSLDEMPELDLVVDGADEFDYKLNLIKGGGGALLREKIIASAAARFMIIADASKRVMRLGRFALPVEINCFGARVTCAQIERAARAAGCTGPLQLRMKEGKIFVTDGGHWIVDCAFGVIPDPVKLSQLLHDVPGVVEHGLFLDMADTIIVADGLRVEVIERKVAVK